LLKEIDVTVVDIVDSSYFTDISYRCTCSFDYFRVEN